MCPSGRLNKLALAWVMFLYIARILHKLALVLMTLRLLFHLSMFYAAANIDYFCRSILPPIPMRTVILIIKMLMYLSSKIVGGYSVRYEDSNLKAAAKVRLMTLHGISSFALAFGITNNSLVDFDFFKTRFADSSLWVVGSALVLLVILSIVIGSLITFLVNRRNVEKNLSDYQS
jgi:hypothetical protein